MARFASRTDDGNLSLGRELVDRRSAEAGRAGDSKGDVSEPGLSVAFAFGSLARAVVRSPSTFADDWPSPSGSAGGVPSPVQVCFDNSCDGARLLAADSFDPRGPR